MNPKDKKETSARNFLRVCDIVKYFSEDTGDLFYFPTVLFLKNNKPSENYLSLLYQLG